MRVLFSGAPLYGHLLPLVPLARALGRRGDEVAFAVPPSLAPVLASEDVEVFPAGAEPLDIRAEILRRIGVNTATAPTADSDCEAFAGAGLDLAVEQVLAVAQQWRPDLVVGDVFSYTALLVAACLDVPAAHVTLRHEVGEFEHALRAMAAQRFEARGLTFRPPRWVLDICPPDLQVPGWRKPPGWMPMRPQAHTAGGGVTRPPHHGERPQLLVTFGTAFSDPKLVDPIVRELTALDVDLRVTVGPTATAEDFNTDSGRIVFERFSPLADLLLGVDLVVAHGGAGTTLGALAAGIPLVLAPQGADQFVVTERAVAAGAAASVLPGPAVPSKIAAAVTTVLTEPSFRDNARRLADQIAAMPAPDEVVDALAAELSHGRPLD